MKETIKKLLTDGKARLQPVLADLVILYADIKHPSSVIFNNSKYKKIFNDLQLPPSKLLKPTKKDTVYFQLIIQTSDDGIPNTIFL